MKNISTVLAAIFPSISLFLSCWMIKLKLWVKNWYNTELLFDDEKVHYN